MDGPYSRSTSRSMRAHNGAASPSFPSAAVAAAAAGPAIFHGLDGVTSAVLGAIPISSRLLAGRKAPSSAARRASCMGGIGVPITRGSESLVAVTVDSAGVRTAPSSS